MKKVHPTDILYRNQVKFSLWVDILASLPSNLTLSELAVEGLFNFMREQEELMKKLSDALSDMPLKIDAIEVEV